MVASTWLQDSGRQEEVVAYVEIDHSDMAATDGGTIATGTYEVVKVPAGAVVTGGHVMISEAFPASVTFDIGDGADVDRYVKKAVFPAVSSIAEQTLGNATYLAITGYKYTTPDTIDIVVAGAAPTASGKIRVCVKYVVEGRAAFSQG